jgi:hypothetical protein
LARTEASCCREVSLRRIEGSSELRELRYRALVLSVLEFERQVCQHPFDFGFMIGVVRRKEEMNVYRSLLFRFDIKAHLDVGEEQIDIWQARALRLPFPHLAVGLDAEVVSHPQGAHVR